MTKYSFLANEGSTQPQGLGPRRLLNILLVCLATGSILMNLSYLGSIGKEDGGGENCDGNDHNGNGNGKVTVESVLRELNSVPHIIHQSWKTDTIPEKFRDWSATWKTLHPTWEYKLWTDEDNRNLVAAHYPWFLSYYDDLPSPISRADSARYFYMHHHGGVYADLDTEAIKPFDQLLSASKGTAFLGAMGHDPSFSQNLPNAWLASRRGHPFWLHVVAVIMRKLEKGIFKAESLTGPVIIKVALEEYEARVGAAERDNVTVLEPGIIYPYNWHNKTAGSHVCWAADKNYHRFNATACKQLFQAEGKPDQIAHMITYWSHSWTVDKGNGGGGPRKKGKQG